MLAGFEPQLWPFGKACFWANFLFKFESSKLVHVIQEFFVKIWWDNTGKMLGLACNNTPYMWIAYIITPGLPCNHRCFTGGATSVASSLTACLKSPPGATLLPPCSQSGLSKTQGCTSLLNTLFIAQHSSFQFHLLECTRLFPSAQAFTCISQCQEQLFSLSSSTSTNPKHPSSYPLSPVLIRCLCWVFSSTSIYQSTCLVVLGFL